MNKSIIDRKTSTGTNSSMEAFLEERAQQLFLLSDQERKGFIVKRDMQRMRTEIPLTPEQLEAVFDSLDVNNNGYLTIEQFLSGFGEFIASHSSDSWDSDDMIESPQSSISESGEPVQSLLQELETIKVLNNIEILRQLCRRVMREANVHIQNNLESFLQHLVVDLKRCQDEQRNLEEALKIKDEEHKSQMKRLFEEMESQIYEDKIRERQEEQRLKSKRSSMEQDLEEKERQLQDAINRQEELSERLHSLRTKENQVKEENERLSKSKKELQTELEAEHREVVQLQRYLADLKQNENWERCKHVSTGFRLAKRIMLEQQGLMHQLHLLQKMTSTLERVDTDSREQVHKVSQNITDEEFNPVHNVSSQGSKPWKKHFFQLDSEDDFYEGTELLTGQNGEGLGSYRQNSATFSR